MFGRNNKSIEGGVCRVIMPERELGSSWKCKAIITLDIRIMCIPIVRMYRYVVCQYAKIMLNSHLIMMKWTIVSGLAYYYITLNFLRPSSRAFSREVRYVDCIEYSEVSRVQFPSGAYLFFLQISRIFLGNPNSRFR